MILLLSRLYRAWRDRAGAVAIPATAGPATAATINDAVRVPAAARGPWALIVHQASFDLRASFRNPRARFFTFVFPVILLVILAGVFGHGTTTLEGVRVPLSRFYVGGILAMSIISASYAMLVVSVASARETGLLKRKRATPVPPWTLIAGQVLATLVTVAIMTALLLVIARLGYGISLPPAALVATVVAAIVGTATFACLGYAVAGLIGSADAAQPIVQATMMPLYFISGVWIPNSVLGSGLRNVASIFPVEHLATAIHTASVNTSLSTAVSGRDLAVLAIWAIAAGTFAARRFRWLPAAAGTA